MSFALPVPSWVISQSRDYVHDVQLGHRGDGSDGTMEQAFVGVIGQNMVQLALGRPTMRGDSGFDGGVDVELFGLGVDVKTMGRTTDPRDEYVNNVMASQVGYESNAYLFLSFNKSSQVLTVCGWIPKELFLHRATLYRKDELRHRSDGTTFSCKADMYEIPNASLYRDATNWPELIVQMYHYTRLFDT